MTSPRTWLAIVLVALLTASCSESSLEPKSVGEAICQSNLEGLEALLKAGHSPNEPVQERDQSPPLLLLLDIPGCKFHGPFRDFTRMLIRYGADPNVAGPGNYTPLMAAAVIGDVEIAKMLVDAGADVRAVNSSGQNAAVYASWNRSSADVLKFLSEQGVVP